jgi:hypothetical protein
VRISARSLAHRKFAIVSSLAAGGVVSLAFAALAFAQADPGPKEPLPGPDSGLSDEERKELHEQGRQVSQQRHRAFVEEFVRLGRDPRELEQAPMMINTAGPRPTLAEAAAAAPLIVMGTVVEQRYEFDSTGFLNTVTTLRVENAIKGETIPEQIEITHPGGPEPMPDGHGVLVVAEAFPPVFVGESAFFFLRPSGGPHPERYVQQPVSGQYPIVDGRTKALDDNPFARDVDGLTVDEFSERVRSATSP